MTRLSLLLILCSLFPAATQAAEHDCPIYGLAPSVSLVNPPAMLHNGFALTSYFGEFTRPTAVVLRFDDIGQLLWVRQLSQGTSLLDWAASAGDGTLLVAGNAHTSGGSGAIVGKLRSDGTLVWSKFLHGAKGSIWGFDGAPDGGGYASMWGGAAELAKTHIGLTLRFTKDGEVAWARAIALGGDAIIQPVIASQPDGVLIGKTWPIAFNKPTAILLIKITESGDLSWAHLISSSERDLGVSSLLTLVDGSFIVVGRAQGSGNAGSDTALIHFDKDGNPLSGNALHAPPLSNLHLISHDAKDWLLLGGTTASGGPSLADPVGSSQPTIARVTVDGQVAWARAEDFDMTGGMLFGLMHSGDHVVAVVSRGHEKSSALLRLSSDGVPLGEKPGAATFVRIKSQKIELTKARIEIDLQSVRLTATDAALSASKAIVDLIPLCPER